MARPRDGKARAAPATISATHAPWPTGSASRTTCSITKAHFCEDVVERFADDYLAGRTPIPLHPLQHGAQVHRPPRAWRASSAPTASPPGTMYGGSWAPADRSCTGRSIRPATSRISSSRRPRSSSISCASPLGGLPKAEVRRIAEGFGLKVAAKPDSQDICFVPDGDYARIVRAVRPEGARPGRIVHAATGEALGEHAGVIHYYGRPAPRTRDRRAGGAALCGRRSTPTRRKFGSARRRCCAVGAARIAETSRIGPLPDLFAPDAPLTAKVRSMARPVPVTLQARWAAARRR